MEENTVQYKREEVLALKNIILPKENSIVKIQEIIVNKTETKEDTVLINSEELVCNLRCSIYFEQYKIGGKNPPKKVYFICEQSTGIAFAFTTKPVIFVDSPYVKNGQLCKIKSLEFVPFNLGKFGNVELGIVNGNNGISINGIRMPKSVENYALAEKEILKAGCPIESPQTTPSDFVYPTQELIEKTFKELGNDRASKIEFLLKLKEIIEREGGKLVNDEVAWIEIQKFNNKKIKD